MWDAFRASGTHRSPGMRSRTRLCNNLVRNPSRNAPLYRVAAKCSQLTQRVKKVCVPDYDIIGLLAQCRKRGIL